MWVNRMDQLVEKEEICHTLSLQGLINSTLIADQVKTSEKLKIRELIHSADP